MYFACTHVTLRATEVPVWQDLGFEVVPEEVDTGSMNTQQALDYDDENCHPVLQSCRQKSSLRDHEYQLARRIRLRQRRGILSQSEIDFFNARFDVIYVATDLTVALNVSDWFQGKVVFRYFGNLENLQRLSDYDGTEIDARAKRLICLPVFETLREQGIGSIFGRVETVHGYPDQDGFQHRWSGVTPDQAAIVVVNNVNEANQQSVMLRRMIPLASAIPIVVLGKNRPERVPSDVRAGMAVKGILSRPDFLTEFAGGRFLIHPYADRHHNHYTNLEAISMGVPVLFRTDNPLYAEQPASLKTQHPAEWYGAFDTESDLFAAADRLFHSSFELGELARRQPVLLEPFSRPAVAREAAGARRHLRPARLRFRDRRIDVGRSLHGDIGCSGTIRAQSELARQAGTVPFYVFAREDDWALLAEGRDGAAALRLPSCGPSRQFLIGDGYPIDPGRYRLTVAGTLPAAGMLHVSAELFQGDACLAACRFSVTDGQGPALFSLEIAATEPWLLSLHLSLLLGDDVDLASAELTRHADVADAATLTSVLDPVTFLGEGRAVPLATLVDADVHSWIAHGSTSRPVVAWHAGAGPLKLLLSKDPPFPPGTYLLELEATGDHGATLEARLELFEGPEVVSGHRAYVHPGNDSGLVLKVDINAERPWALLMELAVTGPGKLRLGDLRLSRVGEARGKGRISGDQTAMDALASGRFVPVLTLFPEAVEQDGPARGGGVVIRRQPAFSATLPAMGVPLGSKVARLSLLLDSSQAGWIQILVELWSDRGPEMRIEESKALIPGRQTVMVDLCHGATCPILRPVLYVKSVLDIEPVLISLRIHHPDKTIRPSD